MVEQCLNLYLMENSNGLERNIMRDLQNIVSSSQKELDKAQVGYYLEVDLKYLEEFHNKHKDLPCATDNENPRK